MFPCGGALSSLVRIVPHVAVHQFRWRHCNSSVRQVPHTVCQDVILASTSTQSFGGLHILPFTGVPSSRKFLKSVVISSSFDVYISKHFPISSMLTDGPITIIVNLRFHIIPTPAKPGIGRSHQTAANKSTVGFNHSAEPSDLHSNRDL
jgi:hypothetical protein